MHRLLVIGATSLAALVLSGPAPAWSWPAEGDVLRPFALGGDAYAAGQHRGIDVAGPAGSSIRAPATGTVSFAGSLPTYGRSLTILTADGYAVTLVHLGTVEVAKGDAVEEGSPVATMGSSGEPEHVVPSVHLGVRVASQQEGYVDPLGLLPPRATAPRPEAQTSPAPSPAATTPSVPTAAAAPPGTAATAPGPAVPAPAAPGASGSPTHPAAAAQAAGASQTGSSTTPATPATSPPGITATPVSAAATPPGDAVVSPPASSPSGAVSAVTDTPSTTPVPTPAAGRTAEFVVSAPAHHVRPNVVARSASRTTETTARVFAPAVAASTTPHLVSDRGVRDDLRALVGEARVERAVSETAAPPEMAAPRPQAAAVSRGRGGHAHVVQTAVRGGGARETPSTVEPTERATRIVGLPPAMTPEPAAATSEPRHARVPSREALAAVALLVLLAAGIVTKAARRIAGDGPVLRHHADLLRELHAPHRARVHDRGSGHLHASPTATRS